MAILSDQIAFELWQLTLESLSPYRCPRGGFKSAAFRTWARFLKFWRLIFLCTNLLSFRI